MAAAAKARWAKVARKKANPSRYIYRTGKEASLWDASLPLVADKLDSFYATY